jgi:hypothetical protein
MTLGFIYSLVLGSKEDVEVQVLTKSDGHFRHGACPFSVTLSSDGPLAASHCLSESQWKQVSVGANLMLRQQVSVFGVLRHTSQASLATSDK